MQFVHNFRTVFCNRTQAKGGVDRAKEVNTFGLNSHFLSLTTSSYRPMAIHTRPVVSGICSRAVSSSLKAVKTDQCPCISREKMLHYSYGWNFHYNGNINEGNSTCFCKIFNKPMDKRTTKKKKVALLLLLHKIVGKQIRQKNSEQSNGCAAQCMLQKHCQEFWLTRIMTKLIKHYTFQIWKLQRWQNNWIYWLNWQN